ncbi:MAG: glycosyl hydrolase [Kordiimonadaceae bacterium]|nr:glycosyl hydrolase [Kordiimonadaceae bacterium]
MKKLIAFALALSLSLTVATMAQDDDDVMSASTFDGLKVRNIGPAYMSGRVADIAVDQKNPSIWYVGIASGGVWKTVNAGTTWDPVFDDEAVYSIGDVTIDPSNSDIIWVGTGENNGGRHIAFGDGVYKSENGGKSWKNMGLGASEHVGDIVIHPTDSDTVWVSAQGPLWSKGGERGVYKTTDGGQTWNNVLEIDEWTGVGSLAMDPSNPDKLYAAAWQRQRTIAALMDTGPGSALYTSDDGGETWSKMTEGLPKGNMGKMGITVSPINTDVVYAVIELDQKKGGFYRSTNKGASWSKMSDQMSGGTGPHYYQEIFADPHTYGRIYMVNAQSYYSDDDGKTWANVNTTNRHVDDHAFAFHPTDKDFILIGSDGGVYESRDDMTSWRFMQGISVAQFYKVAMDDALPFYNVFGGTQDNSTQGGPSRTMRANGIKNSDWYLTMGADGHQPATEPGNPNIMYSQMQQGGLMRHDALLRENVSVQPQPAPGDPAERFNWDAPINVSHHNPARLYHASQRLWRSDDRGDSWRAISGDLTRNGNRLHMPMMDRTWSREAGWDLGAMSNFFTIANVAESPVDENILYVGTDDGLIQMTSDGGENWTRYEVGDINGVPENSYVNDIRADRFDADTVYAALDNHKEGDYAPYLIKSTNRGQSWSMITGGLPDKTLVWRITQDHVDQNLMFLGTEFGLYFTVDGGDQWIELTGDVPTISFRDVRIQRRENDLVAGSFGRGIFILDDYTALRGLNADSLESEALLFANAKTPWYREDTLHSGSQGDEQWTAKNPAFGTTMTYYLKDSLKSAKDIRVEADKDLVKDGQGTTFPSFDVLEAERREAEPELYITIKDANGNVIRNVEAANKKGVNRVTWNLRHAAQVAITSETSGNNARRPSGTFAVPGTYTATLNARSDGTSRELAAPVSFELVRITDQALQGANMADASRFQNEVADAQASVAAANSTVTDLMDKLKLYRMAMDRASGGAALEGDYNAMRAELYAIDEMLNGERSRGGLGSRPATITSRVNYASRSSGTTYGPTIQSREQLGYAVDAFGGVKARLATMTSTTVPAFESAMETAGAPWVRGGDIR